MFCSPCKMATTQVDVSAGFANLTREQFRKLTKEQLIGLAEAEDVELAEGMKKPAIGACIIETLHLETIWQEQQEEREEERQRAKEREKLEREREKLEREREVERHKEKMARLEFEKLATRQKEHSFDISKARGFMPPFEEDSVDIFF